MTRVQQRGEPPPSHSRILPVWRAQAALADPERSKGDYPSSDSEKVEDILVKPLYRFGHTLFKALLKALFRFRVYGQHNLRRGKAIIAANHQSYIDPLAIGAGVPEEICYMAREDVFRFAPLRWLCLNVNTIMIKRRRADRAALTAILSKLADGSKLLIFPEGTRSHEGQLQPPQHGISLLAHKSGAPVIPAYVSGTFEALPRGATMIHLHPISVSFGPALHFDELSLKGGARRAYETFSRQIMDAIARLKVSPQNLPAPERPRRS